MTIFFPTDTLNVYYCFLYKLLVFDYIDWRKDFFSLFMLAADFVFCSEIVLVYFNFQFQMNVQMEINCVRLSLFVTLFNNFPCTVFNLHLFIIVSASFTVVLLFCQHYYIIDGVRSWIMIHWLWDLFAPSAGCVKCSNAQVLSTNFIIIKLRCMYFVYIYTFKGLP